MVFDDIKVVKHNKLMMIDEFRDMAVQALKDIYDAMEEKPKTTREFLAPSFIEKIEPALKKLLY